MSRGVLYGDVNPNLIDGSSIWLSSISEVLASVVDEVHVFLKARINDHTLTQHLLQIPSVTLHEPKGRGDNILTPSQAAEWVDRFVAENHVDAVIVRGLEACTSFATRTALAPKLWSYITDLPFPPSAADQERMAKVDEVARRSRRMLAQTDAARAYLESIVPSAAGKTIVTPPMIPAPELGSVHTEFPEQLGTHDRPVRLVYAGKMAAQWKTLEMLELPAALARLGVRATLDVAGAKVNAKKGDPEWAGRMLEALKSYDSDPGSGVTWHGSLSRSDSIKLIQESHLGVGWRTSELDSSLEVSTKALEYGLNHTVPIVNRTRDHVELLGAQYPFFASADDTPADLAGTIAQNLSTLTESARVALDAASTYSFHEATKRFRDHFDRVAVGDPTPDRRGIKNLLIASHDLKFMGELMDRWTVDDRVRLRIDGWKSLHQHDERSSSRDVAWADTVLCEWAGPNLVWYSNNKKPGQKLISRLHRFELGGKWLEAVAWDQVDQLIFVSEFIREDAVRQLKFPREKTKVIPNAVDTVDLDRPKEYDAQFHLGVIGFVPILKRPDLAVRLLERLIEEDDRYQLHFKGRMPWEYPYEWNKPVQKQRYLTFFNRIGSNPALKDSVRFEPFSPDMGNWLRRVGFVLSPSDLESFHLAPAEGMASGAVPIVRKREGSAQIFGAKNVFSSIDEAAVRILSLRDRSEFQKSSAAAKRYAKDWDIEKVIAAWNETL